MTYADAIRYLESFINYEKIPRWPYKKSLKLERMQGLMAQLGDPHKKLRCIHVAGTKGKGSTCAFIASILREHGYSVGLYTSPHLEDFRERIRILEKNARPIVRRSRVPCSQSDFDGMIPKADLARIIGRLKPVIERYNRASGYGPISFFEAYTVIAFYYFHIRKVDFVVLETGLGGRLDATNVCEPLVCGITPISIEHTDKLGHTIAAIAREKAGIIKKRDKASALLPLSVIVSRQVPDARKVFRARCRAMHCTMREVGSDIIIRSGRGKRFNIYSRHTQSRYAQLRVRLAGGHQIDNAALAIGVVESLQPYGLRLKIGANRRGLIKTVWPGRCEVVNAAPLIILDGAQNAASARALRTTLRECFRFRKLVLVLGVSRDKDIRGIINELAPRADEVILTKADTPRACEPVTLAQFVTRRNAYSVDSVRIALNIALDLAQRHDAIVVTGSLFVVGEARAYLRTLYHAHCQS